MKLWFSGWLHALSWYSIPILTIPSALDDVAWLLNLRGSDIHFNPVFFSYAAVTEKEVFLENNNLKLFELPKTDAF